MKKYHSVFGLIARSSLLKLALLLAVSMGVQWYFYVDNANEYLVQTDPPMLEWLMDLSAANVYFAITTVAAIIILSLHGCEFGSKCRYTVKRLQISEFSYTVLQTIYNLCIFIIFYSAELVITYMMCWHYVTNVSADIISTQTVFLAYYRNEFLHSLMPLDDITLWIRNILTLLALSLGCSHFSLRHRRGKYAISVMFCAVFAVVWNRGTIGGDITAILLMLIDISLIMLYVYRMIETREVGEYDQ